MNSCGRHLLPFLLLTLLAGAVSSASAQALRFYARPYQVFQGDQVNFIFRNDLATVHYEDIVSWKWDFNGDGTWDQQVTVNPANGIYPESINPR